KREVQTGKLAGLAMIVGSKWKLVSMSRFEWDLDLIRCLEWGSSRRMESSEVVEDHRFKDKVEIC
ncbi:hypothetical protein A2U01_0092915, partial [Trifolium medium]|nr:hypothetical protein [Trifolium medium]